MQSFLIARNSFNISSSEREAKGLNNFLAKTERTWSVVARVFGTGISIPLVFVCPIYNIYSAEINDKLTKNLVNFTVSPCIKLLEVSKVRIISTCPPEFFRRMRESEDALMDDDGFWRLRWKGSH
jgi:hypothetical protein